MFSADLLHTCSNERPHGARILVLIPTDAYVGITLTALQSADNDNPKKIILDSGIRIVQIEEDFDKILSLYVVSLLGALDDGLFIMYS
jgi:hypothetical protein